MALSPASSRAAAFNGGTITGRLKIADPVASHVGLEIAAPVGSIAAHTTQLSVYDENTDGLLAVDADGNHFVSIRNDGFHFWILQTQQGAALLRVGATDIGVGLPMRFGNVSPPILGNVSAPASGSLNPSECALWFDDTNGVGNTKLMVKAKSADGTVKTATIVLA